VLEPIAGSRSVVLQVIPENSSWKAVTDVSWLHLSPENQKGVGSTNVIFSYDANPGATCVGTITIGDQTLVITQPGSSYIETKSITPLVNFGECLSGVAVDGAGNIYIADSLASAIYERVAATGKLTILLSSGLLEPFGIAVDNPGNIYIADTLNNSIKKWTAANGTLSTLVSSGLSRPQGVAVDTFGNVYIADTKNNAIKEWSSVSGTVTTLVSEGLSGPCGVAVDRAGNVYIADTKNNVIKKWTAATGSAFSLISTGLLEPLSIVLDGEGNVYIADSSHNAIKKWTAADATMTVLISSGLDVPSALAFDGADSLYVADSNNQTIKRLAHAFVDPTAKSESASAGGDVLPPVLPRMATLLGPFAPATDAPWLKIGGITNGAVCFSFSANSGPSRTANLTLLGQSIPITQEGLATPQAQTDTQTPSYSVSPVTFSNNQGATFPVLSTTNLPTPASQ
jgi:sugar lactone lactonase YvrE